MPLVLAILSIAQGLSNVYHGDKLGGAAGVFNGVRSFGQLSNNFDVLPDNNVMTDAGVRRNYL